jgi:uncharacterized C2H2 Zn-finger protein
VTLFESHPANSITNAISNPASNASADTNGVIEINSSESATDEGEPLLGGHDLLDEGGAYAELLDDDDILGDEEDYDDDEEDIGLDQSNFNGEYLEESGAAGMTLGRYNSFSGAYGPNDGHDSANGMLLMFKCRVCGKAFKHRRSLNRHVKLHSGEKNFKCPYCATAFARSDHLKAHIHTHNNSKPYRCSVCQCGYSTQAALKVRTLFLLSGLLKLHDQFQGIFGIFRNLFIRLQIYPI